MYFTPEQKRHKGIAGFRYKGCMDGDGRLNEIRFN
jgi:hypothetical protein